MRKRDWRGAVIAVLIATFGESADPREIERECFDHAARVDAACGFLERLLGRPV